MSSAEPRLKQFELEISPLQFRFAVLSGDNMLVGYKPGGADRPHIITTRYQGNEEKVEAMLESLQWLLVANNLPETPVTAPNCVFNPMYMRDPSVHLLFAYSDGRKWGSMYRLDSLPDNVRDLVDQVRYLAIQSVEGTSGEATATA